MYKKDEIHDKAVSPVIGVILVVAITVILAAVIGTFVLVFGSQIEQNARAGVNANVDSSNGDVKITVTTMGNADYVVIRGANKFESIRGSYTTGGATVYDNIYLNETGQSAILDAPNSSTISGQVTVVAFIGAIPTDVSPPPVAESDYPDDSTTQTVITTIQYKDLQSPT